ncbi:MAG: helix-turn-helix transcriptional regulator [Elusimicrobiales bacterium]|jgi:transcriptional regulator with XRE-family HTH domain
MKTEGYRANIGRKVRQERLNLGWSQEELAEKIEVHPSFVGQIERGLKTASFDTLDKLAAVFGVKTTDFLEPLAKAAAPAKPIGYERKISELVKGLSLREQTEIYKTIRYLLRRKRTLGKR